MNSAANISPSRSGRGFALSKLGAFFAPNSYLHTHFNFLLREINPALSLNALMAQVVAVIPETADTHSYVIRPPRRWQGFTAGMHIPITVEINGVLTRRTYTISSTPEQYQRQGTIAITVKRLAGGRLSSQLFKHLNVGQWLEIGEAIGEFTLDKAVSDKVLFLAAGSGITPFFSMLNSFLKISTSTYITLMYYCRRQDEFIFAQQLTKLAKAYSHFTLVPIFTDMEGRIDAIHLLQHCPDVAHRDVFVCGPEGFMARATTLLQQQGVTQRQIFQESFGRRLSPINLQTSTATSEVSFSKSTVRIESDGKKTILELAELAGLTPKYGCRSGICHECKCTKMSGQVVDYRNGKKSSFDAEEIQVCVSIPHGVVEIAL
jgi:ferredoxin-NADP reductase